MDEQMKESLRLAANISEKLYGRHHTDSTELVRDDRSLGDQPTVERELALDDLLADVTEENRHSEMDFDPPVGKERNWSLKVNEEILPPRGNQFRLSRLNIFLFDLRQALAFSDYILNKHLHDVKTDTAKAKLVHLAFNTSLIVSYIRPFHNSYEFDGRPSVALSVDAAVLDADETTLHAKLLDKRDRTFAHSDARSHEIEGFHYDAKTVKLYKNAFDPLTLEETRLLGQMIRKWITYVESLRTAARHQSQ